MKKLLVTLFAMLFTLWMKAQGTSGNLPDQASGLRADGKIYVVIAVVVTILAGLFLYVILLDRKISKLENRQSATGSRQ